MTTGYTKEQIEEAYEVADDYNAAIGMLDFGDYWPLEDARRRAALLPEGLLSVDEAAYKVTVNDRAAQDAQAQAPEAGRGDMPFGDFVARLKAVGYGIPEINEFVKEKAEAETARSASLAKAAEAAPCRPTDVTVVTGAGRPLAAEYGGTLFRFDVEPGASFDLEAFDYEAAVLEAFSTMHGHHFDGIDIKIGQDGRIEAASLVCADKKFERIRRITGYLVGDMGRFNDAKRAEVADRVKHGLEGFEARLDQAEGSARRADGQGPRQGKGATAARREER